MSTSFRPLNIKKVLARHYAWVGLPEQFGPDGWSFRVNGPNRSVIVTAADHNTGVEWWHASIASPDETPDYWDLKVLHEAVFTGYAYQVFAPPEHHVNIHEHALHLWGRADGKPAIPSLAQLIEQMGSI